MLNWILQIFATQDATAERVNAAGQRIATAAESMADAWETAAAAMGERLGVETGTAPLTLTTVETNGHANGRKRVKG